jgi:hypothetical protein
MLTVKRERKIDGRKLFLFHIFWRPVDVVDFVAKKNGYFYISIETEQTGKQHRVLDVVP